MSIQEVAWKPKEQQQRTLAPLSVPGASSAGSIRVVSGSGFRYVVPFPYRLHEMLSNVDEKNDSSIVSWLPDGKHFKVHDPRRFVEIVIPSAFKQKSLKSFQRQLHLYGFQRVHEGVDKGAYYHEKFRRDDRDLCLSITRTKAPKRSRVSSSIQKKSFAPKAPVFPSVNSTNNNINNNTQAIGRNTAHVATTNLSAVTVSPTMFDVSPQAHSSFVAENSISIKGPLHKTVSIDGASVSNNSPSNQSASSLPQQQLNLHQQLEGSIAETCRWLINAGVPISAFDPVAIGDISHSTFSVPQLVPSATPLTPGIPRQSTIISENGSENGCNSNLNTAPMDNNHATESQLQFNNNELATSAEMNSLLSAGPTANNFDPLTATFQDDLPDLDNDPLLTTFLPGEQVPAVDDFLWAL